MARARSREAGTGAYVVGAVDVAPVDAVLREVRVLQVLVRERLGGVVAPPDDAARAAGEGPGSRGSGSKRARGAHEVAAVGGGRARRMVYSQQAVVVPYYGGLRPVRPGVLIGQDDCAADGEGSCWCDALAGWAWSSCG